MEIKDEIIEAIRANNREKLRELREQLTRDKWLNEWRDRGSNMSEWIELENPFIKFTG
jgi:hypothetical protein